MQGLPFVQEVLLVYHKYHAVGVDIEPTLCIVCSRYPHAIACHIIQATVRTMLFTHPPFTCLFILRTGKKKRKEKEISITE
jgi:hypothetical protein